MRLQLALNVHNINEAVAYYGKLFDAEPHKRRPGYANFALSQPPLKLVLFENPDADQRLNHLGVEVFESGDVEKAARRLAEAGLLDDTCQRRSKISPVGRRKTSPFYVMPKALLWVVPVVHRRDPRGFA